MQSMNLRKEDNSCNKGGQCMSSTCPKAHKNRMVQDLARSREHNPAFLEHVKFTEIWMYVSCGIRTSPVIPAIAKLEEKWWKILKVPCFLSCTSVARGVQCCKAHPLSHQHLHWCQSEKKEDCSFLLSIWSVFCLLNLIIFHCLVMVSAWMLLGITWHSNR